MIEQTPTCQYCDNEYNLYSVRMDFIELAERMHVILCIECLEKLAKENVKYKQILDLIKWKEYKKACDKGVSCE